MSEKMSSRETPTGNPVTALQAYIESKTPDLQKWAVGATDATTLVKFALFDCAENEKLQKCSHKTIYFSLIAAAKIGLSPDGVHGAIVPYGTVATFQPMYQGLIQLAIDSGAVKVIKTGAVYEGDEFDADLGRDNPIVHKPCLVKRGELIAAWAEATLDSGVKLAEVLSKDDIAAIRKKAAAGSMGWNDFEGQMARKSAVKRIYKLLPKTAQMVLAQKIDDMATIGDQAGYRKIIDVESD